VAPVWNKTLVLEISASMETSFLSKSCEPISGDDSGSRQAVVECGPKIPEDAQPQQPPISSIVVGFKVRSGMHVPAVIDDY
jgi:hypothetical protein